MYLIFLHSLICTISKSARVWFARNTSEVRTRCNFSIWNLIRLKEKVDDNVLLDPGVTRFDRVTWQRYLFLPDCQIIRSLIMYMY